MKHALHIRPNKKQRWLDEAVLVLREQGEALSGNEIYSRTHGRVNANAMPKNARSAGQMFKYDSGKRFFKSQVGKSDRFVYGLKEWDE